MDACKGDKGNGKAQMDTVRKSIVKVYSGTRAENKGISNGQGDSAGGGTVDAGQDDFGQGSLSKGRSAKDEVEVVPAMWRCRFDCNGKACAGCKAKGSSKCKR
jgi:hypothetical protein